MASAARRVLSRVIGRAVASALSKVRKEDLLNATGTFSFSKLDGKTFRDIAGTVATSIALSTLTEYWMAKYKDRIIAFLQDFTFERVLDYLKGIRPDLVEAMRSRPDVYSYWEREWEVLKSKLIDLVREM